MSSAILGRDELRRCVWRTLLSAQRAGGPYDSERAVPAPPWFFTDDTVMALSILEAGDPELRGLNYRRGLARLRFLISTSSVAFAFLFFLFHLHEHFAKILG